MLKKLAQMFFQSGVSKKQDVGEFTQMKAGGMKFAIESFFLDNLGTLSTMQAKGFFGLVKMDTLIFTPKYKDAPLLSYDRMNFFGKDIFIFEMYDTCSACPKTDQMKEIQLKYADLPDDPPKPHWYDSIRLNTSTYKVGKKANKQSLDTLAKELTAAYLSILSKADVCDGSIKNEKNSRYVNGLLENGGPSTDVFIKQIGKEKTRELFEKYLFGTQT